MRCIMWVKNVYNHDHSTKISTIAFSVHLVLPMFQRVWGTDKTIVLFLSVTYFISTTSTDITKIWSEIMIILWRVCRVCVLREKKIKIGICKARTRMRFYHSSINLRFYAWSQKKIHRRNIKCKMTCYSLSFHFLSVMSVCRWRDGWKFTTEFQHISSLANDLKLPRIIWYETKLYFFLSMAWQIYNLKNVDWGWLKVIILYTCCVSTFIYCRSICPVSITRDSCKSL